jgi:DNA recombination protein RmuC
MADLMNVILLVLLAAILVVLVLLWRRAGGVAPGLGARIEALERSLERGQRQAADDFALSRREAAVAATALREEVAGQFRGSGDLLLNAIGALGQTHQERLQAFSEETGRALAGTRQEAGGSAERLREQVVGTLTQLSDSVSRRLTDHATLQQSQWDTFQKGTTELRESSARRLEELRVTLETQLEALRALNAQKLDEMRQTVDEKLQATLEERLGASFKLVSERLEQVHRGLGEMQVLASGVGDLKRVLTNVKSRGTWGEVQLGTLLEQVLAPDQYAPNVVTREGSGERVEFAVRLPGPDGREGETVWLPIDAKFPMEDYQRLMDAAERGDALAAEQHARDVEVRVKAAAREICNKYLNPPATTDFAILFVPTEGLYAEVLRRPGLPDFLQRECRVLVAGPTTLWAILSSLRMGFRTLAIQRRSSEVWQTLGAVKTEFTKFGGMLDAVHKKLGEASRKIEDARRGSRRIERTLRDVQELPATEAVAVLGSAPLFDREDEPQEDEEE